MSTELIFWLFLLAFLLVPFPLALLLLFRVRRLERRAPGASDPESLARLRLIEQRLATMEQALAKLREPSAPPVSPVESAAAPLPKPLAAPVRPAEPTAATSTAPSAETERQPRLDLETLIAGRWLNRIGILALLFALAFFLKYAFDNHWIGPRGQVAAGLLLGSGLMVYSQWLFRRGWRYFSEGIAGLGAGALYLSLYAGANYYHFMPRPLSFAAMVAVTALMAALAIGRNSQRIALLALSGGFLTPALLSTGQDQQVALFTYLAVLTASLLALAYWRGWRTLEMVSFALVQLYFWTWFERFYRPEKLASTAGFASLFFVLFAITGLVRCYRGRWGDEQVLLALLNPLALGLALHQMLWPDRRWSLTLAVLLLAIWHLVAARLARTGRAGAPPLAALLYAGIALTLVTVAIPIRLEGRWITLGWAVEGAVLVWSGLRVRQPLVRLGGALLLYVVLARLLAVPLPAERLLLNQRFGAVLVTLGCLGLAVWLARRQRAELVREEPLAFGGLGIGFNLLAVWAVSLELWEHYGRVRGLLELDPDLARQLALSLWWALYATSLMVLGVRAESAPLRWQALALLGLVVGKVFLYDLSFLQRGYRILSFLALGVALLWVSFFYQRRTLARRAAKRT